MTVIDTPPSVRCSSDIYLNMIYISCYLLLFNMAFATSRFGPYKCLLQRAQPCAKQTKPVVKNPPILFNAQVYNMSTKTHLLRGNFTVIRDAIAKKLSLKAYYWEFGKWNPQYIMNNIGCSSVFLPVALKTTHINVDFKTCKFFKGSHVFQNLDANAMQHVWMSTQEYGRIMWTTEFFIQAGSVWCWEFETDIQPA